MERFSSLVVYLIYLKLNKKRYLRLSRKGITLDNAPIESFHFSLKSETFYLYKEHLGSNNIEIDIIEI
ncbi:hypothetical protein LIWE8149_04970 [Listeria welshimeri]